MRLSISIPDNLHKQVLVAAANQQLQTMKAVTVNDFIRAAIGEKLNMLTCDGDVKDNNTTDTTAPEVKSTMADGDQVKKRCERKITPDQHGSFQRCRRVVQLHME